MGLVCAEGQNIYVRVYFDFTGQTGFACFMSVKLTLDSGEKRLLLRIRIMKLIYRFNEMNGIYTQLYEKNAFTGMSMKAANT